MEQLPNGFTLELPKGAFPLSTDSMVLAHFARLPKNARVLDLGSGCGTLGLLLCSRDPHCHVTGLELTEKAHLAAMDNIRRNGVSHRMVSICADLKSVSERFSPGCFDLCLSNPPYFSGGPASKELPLARREDACSAGELLRSAAWSVKFGGDVYLVHRPERLAELIAAASRLQLEAKRLLLLRHRENGPISLIFLQFRKGGKPGLLLEEESLHDSRGNPTNFYNMVYYTIR